MRCALPLVLAILFTSLPHAVGDEARADKHATAAIRHAPNSLPPHPILDLVGHRADKNSVGHARNVALYTGEVPPFFFATHELGDIFSAARGQTIEWFPDHVVLDPRPPQPTNAPEPVTETRRVCVTKDDVVVCQIFLTNTSDKTAPHRIEIDGDCRRSFDWREKPAGDRFTERIGDRVLVRDTSVFPAFLTNGLSIAVGASERPNDVQISPPGTCQMFFSVPVSKHSTCSLILACAIHPDHRQAQKHLTAVLKQKEPLTENRKEWAAFFDEAVPRFACSDRGLEELYAFRWFLLRFSTAGGDLGYFKYPVVLEGRQAYQTYCCYSAPFMAFDMNWAVDPKPGFGHIATMAHAAYDDGRFPWYTSPRTNKVQLHHESRTLAQS
ncbi:MAG: hypothetical protein HY735_01140 [Verrucomicrobia bacterium]|nr:hypothetical protein [Verrucomicrobiota bacterium]